MTEPAYRHFRLTYPSGAVIESYSGEGELTETLRAAHPLAQVTAIEESRIQPTVTGQAAGGVDSPAT